MKLFFHKHFVGLLTVQTNLCLKHSSYVHQKLHYSTSLFKHNCSYLQGEKLSKRRHLLLLSGLDSCQRQISSATDEHILLSVSNEQITPAVPNDQLALPSRKRQNKVSTPNNYMNLSASSEHRAPSTNEQEPAPALQKTLFDQTDECNWINSPRSFYMQSLKYATMTQELLTHMKANNSLNSAELIAKDRTLNKLFYTSQSASDNNPLESVKKLNNFPKSVVQEIYNLNLTFFKKVINNITTLNNEILKEYFKFFAKLDNIENEMKTFEHKCCVMMDTWPVDTVLLVCDAFHLINYRALSFNEKMYDFIGKRVHLLSRYNIVQLVYLIGENRNVPSSLMSRLEKRMLNYMNEFTVPEIGAVCNGFFKSQTQIFSKRILTQFAKRLILEDLRAIDSHSLVGICKMYRYAYFGSEKLFSKVAREIVEKVPRMDIEAITHIALTYSSLRMYHAPLMDGIAQAYVKKIKNGRCKDVAKCLWSMTTLAHVPSNVNQFYNTAINEIRRRLVEYSKHPNQLTSTLLSLAYADIYPLDIIDYVFNTAFLHSVKKFRLANGIDLRPDLHLLNSAVLVDRPLYCSNKLPKELLEGGDLPDDFYPDVQQELNKRAFLKPVISCISEILGDSQVIKPCFIIPHMKTLDVELRLSELGEPIPVSKWGLQDNQSLTKSLSASAMVQQIMQQNEQQTPTNLKGMMKLKTGECKQDASSTKIAIVLWSRNHYRFGAKENLEARHLLGLHAMKKRHLLLLGYKIIELPFYEVEDEVHKETLNQYLTNKLMEVPEMRLHLEQNS